MRFLLFGNSVMLEHQRVEKNENIAKTNIFNFVEFSFRHYVASLRKNMIKVYERQADGTLNFVEDIDCQTGVDNIELGEINDLWV